MNLMLSARELGYDSCPMIGFDPVKVSEVLGFQYSDMENAENVDFLP